jgi:hypothetical protein
LIPLPRTAAKRTMILVWYPLHPSKQGGRHWYVVLAHIPGKDGLISGQSIKQNVPGPQNTRAQRELDSGAGSSSAGPLLPIISTLRPDTAASSSGVVSNLPPTSTLEVKCMARTRIPTPYGPVFLHLYHNNRDNKEHLAIVVDAAQQQDGEPSSGTRFSYFMFYLVLIASIKMVLFRSDRRHWMLVGGPMKPKWTVSYVAPTLAN